MSLYRFSTVQESLAVHIHERPRYLAASGSEHKDWLAEMILTARAMATGAEFVPLPGVRAAFGAVVLLLETVDKIKRNREDLRDLCASTFEIVLILEEEVKIHGHSAALQFAGLLESFISFLRFLQNGLERLLERRSGLRGRFQEILGATRMTEEISRHRMHLHELRSNFLLVTTINTNLNVTEIQNSIAALQLIPGTPDFRNVALGDINLIYETAMGSKIRKIKIFVARISGESSAMTVVKYDDEVEHRYPHVWQLFGISRAPGFRALIFHDELIPLPIYRQFHRPESDFFWACAEAILFKQFKGLTATICVKREPLGICLTMPESERDWDVDKLEDMLSSWHGSCFSHRVAPNSSKKILTILALGAPPAKLSEVFNWDHFFAMLTPIWIPTFGPWKPKFFLGSVVTRFPFGSPNSRVPPGLPVAYIPNNFPVLVKEWTMGEPPKSTPGCLYEPERNSQWQQRKWSRRRGFHRRTLTLVMASQMESKSNSTEVYLFVAPLVIKYEASRVRVDPPQADGFYWSLDPTGNPRLSLEECDSLGVPRYYLGEARARAIGRQTSTTRSNAQIVWCSPYVSVLGLQQKRFDRGMRLMGNRAGGRGTKAVVRRAVAAVRRTAHPPYQRRDGRFAIVGGMNERGGCGDTRGGAQVDGGKRERLGAEDASYGAVVAGSRSGKTQAWLAERWAEMGFPRQREESMKIRRGEGRKEEDVRVVRWTGRDEGYDGTGHHANDAVRLRVGTDAVIRVDGDIEAAALSLQTNPWSESESDRTQWVDAVGDGDGGGEEFNRREEVGGLCLCERKGAAVGWVQSGLFEWRSEGPGAGRRSGREKGGGALH
ncbi:hypothetical protein B0H19DRAFT_1077108 [Mycena capillaripes]|nr:hypothetical protein B0H19DRAFT_1077108 [Mycena capillaripes]